MYGICVSPAQDLPVFPALVDEDQDILKPRPSDASDASLCTSQTPFVGCTYDRCVLARVQLALSADPPICFGQQSDAARDLPPGFLSVWEASFCEGCGCETPLS